MRPLPFALALALATLGTGGDAMAHKMKLFATAEGATVSGYVYFSPGGRAQDAAVVASTPDGATVFQGRTDDQGGFRFDARQRADHRITADGGDGHTASFTIQADELPATLSADRRSGGIGSVASSTDAIAVPLPPGASAPVSAALPPGDLAALIEQSVARQIRPLREQLDADREAVRWHDAVGGIGYIIGLAGLAYGLAARAKGRGRQRRPGGKEEAAR